MKNDLLLTISKDQMKEVYKKVQRRKKNGAHNHLSHLQKPRASKYSRHVVLCKYNK